jgi:hypothetical protein
VQRFHFVIFDFLDPQDSPARRQKLDLMLHGLRTYQKVLVQSRGGLRCQRLRRDPVFSIEGQLIEFLR